MSRNLSLHSESSNIDSVVSRINPDGKVFKLLQQNVIIARQTSKHDEIISGLTELRDNMLKWVEFQMPNASQISDEIVKVGKILSKAEVIKSADSRLTSQLANLKLLYSQLLEESEHSKSQISDLTAEVATLAQIIDEQDGTITDLRTTITDLRTTLTEQDRTNTDLRTTITDLRTTLTEQEGMITELKMKLSPIEAYAAIRAAEIRFIEEVCSVDDSYDVVPLYLVDLKNDVKSGEASLAVAEKWSEMNGDNICSLNLSKLFGRLSCARTKVAHEEIGDPGSFAKLSEEDFKIMLSSNPQVRIPKKDLEAGLALHMATCSR